MVVARGIEVEEVAGDLSEDERLQAGEIEHAEVQRLLDGGQEGTGRIGAFHLEQATQGTQAAAMGALLEGGGIACEAFVIATQQLLLERSEEHTSELQSHLNLVCRLLLEKKKKRRHMTQAVAACSL